MLVEKVEEVNGTHSTRVDVIVGNANVDIESDNYANYAGREIAWTISVVVNTVEYNQEHGVALFSGALEVLGDGWYCGWNAHFDTDDSYGYAKAVICNGEARKVGHDGTVSRTSLGRMHLLYHWPTLTSELFVAAIVEAVFGERVSVQVIDGDTIVARGIED